MESPVPKKASPTDYLANERTFLAWIRTGIAIMAFGFVAVKFSLFLNQVNLLSGENIKLPNAGHSYWIGMGLVILGTIMSLLAFIRYRQVENQLHDSRFRSSTVLSLLLTVCILFAGILLVIYLL
jgi:putative membrane protein